MAFCANCGAKIGDSDKFCGSCGSTRVTGAPAAQAPPPPVYQAPPIQPQSPPPMYQPPMGGPQMNAGTSGDSSTGLQANIAGLLCYLGVWVTGIVFLIIEKKSQSVRFHAAQSLVVFGVLSILGFILNLIPYIRFVSVLISLLSAIVGLLAFILWLILMYKAYQGETYKLPIVGNIASGIAGKM
jgi:uncharacterized membrane protein